MDAPRVVFIGGLGRSGSTLLERLLGELPGALAMGEVVHLWQRGVVDDERCGCGEAFSACPFWGEVGQAAFGGWDAFDAEAFFAAKAGAERTRFVPELARRRLRPPMRARVDRLNGYYLRLYEAVAKVGGRGILVDSSKNISLACCLRWCAGLDLRVVHVVRDPRAVAYSWSKVVRRPEAVEASAEGAFMARWSPVRTAMHWNAQNLGCDLLARAGVPALRVRYEDFAADPVRTVGEIARFAGLDDDRLPFTDEVTVELSANHQVAGNPLRFHTGPVTLRRDEAWRSGFSAPNRTLVTAMTLPVLRRYGYPLVV